MFTAAKETKLNTAKDSMVNEGGPAGDSAREEKRRLNDEARHEIGDMHDDLENVARRTGHHVRELADSAGHNFSDVVGVVKSKIRDKPVQSSLIALGVGIFAGILYRR